MSAVDHSLEAKRLLVLSQTHTDTADSRDDRIAALVVAQAQVHATLALTEWVKAAAMRLGDISRHPGGMP